MLEHVCQNEERLRTLEGRMGVSETKTSTLQEDIKEIKDTLKALMYWIMGLMATTILTLLTNVINSGR